jgi:hypothetical protein
MDFTTAVTIIKKDLEEAGVLLDQLSTTAVNHPAELKLARSRVRSAAEMLAVLPELKDAAKAEVEVKAKETVEPGVEVRKKAVTKVEIMAEAKAEDKVETKAEAETLAEVEAETLDVQAVEAKIENEPEVKSKPEVKAVPDLSKTPEVNISRLSDRFNDSGRMVEQVTKVRQDEVITSAMHARPIADIAAAIGINDKFYFIRELFSGDGKAYIDTIGRLNSAASLGEAMRILDESTVMGSDPAAQSSFVDVVRRKFNING